MKKISTLLVIVMLSFCVLLTGCKQDPDTIRVNEVTHSIFYAPLYVAINKGYFEDEGLKIELTNGGGADKSMAALTSKSADIGLMGPEAAVYVTAQGKSDVPTVFGQLTKKDGSFIVSKTNIENFKWSDMTNKRIIGGRPGGVPAMALEYALNQNGLIDGTNIDIITNIDFNNMASAFIGNDYEFVTCFEPVASALVQQGKGYNVASVGLMAGEMPFTCFMANKSYIDSNPQRIEKFLRAIIKAYNYCMSANVDDVVEALAPSFGTTDKATIKSAFLSYKGIDAWNATPIMNENAYNKLIEVITKYGTLTQNVPFNKIVDNSYAEKVLQSMA